MRYRRMNLDHRQEARVELLRRLRAEGYSFVAPTLDTHRRVRSRRKKARPGNLRDVLGWCLPFRREDMPQPFFDLLRGGEALNEDGEDCRATLRVSTLEGRLFAHSCPGAGDDAVFLGPDSYRFVRFIRETLGDNRPAGRILDIGTGAGAGAVFVAALHPDARVVGSDPNAAALALFQVNARAAGVKVEAVEASGIPAEPSHFDLIIANPPYIAGEGNPLYSAGGDELGEGLALEWARAGAGRLDAGGRFILYTGATIVDGYDVVRAGLEEIAADNGLSLRYEEIDPDVFGEEIGRGAYAQAERIAAVGAVLEKPL